VLFALGNAVLLARLRRQLVPSDPNALLHALMIAAFPVHVFFSVLFYTDNGAAFFVLLMYSLAERVNVLLVPAARGSYVLSALVSPPPCFYACPSCSNTSCPRFPSSQCRAELSRCSFARRTSYGSSSSPAPSSSVVWSSHTAASSTGEQLTELPRAILATLHVFLCPSALRRRKHASAGHP
jgi:hypothetical protein